MSTKPRVLVLLATYNGVTWLDEQLDTLLSQIDCDLRTVVSDDQSSDETLRILRARADRDPRIHLHDHGLRFGSAGLNFYHLIEHAELGDAQYIAFADQDDHWMPDKLMRAVTALQTSGASGYSSNFWAWYPHRGDLRRLVRKSQPQQTWDHLFQGPGPGCTFVLTRDYFVQLREFVRQHRDGLKSVFHHDWLMYAHARATQHLWHIDEAPTMLYRQHERNETGVSLGWRAAIKRLRMIRSGWLRDQVLSIAALLNEQQKWPIQAMTRLHLSDRLQLALHVRQLRRGWRDRLALAIALLLLVRGAS